MKDDLKNKTYEILRNELLQTEEGIFYVSESMDYIYSDMVDDYEVIKDKILKVVKKMNEMNKEELEKFVNLDFQEEIFDEI